MELLIPWSAIPHGSMKETSLPLGEPLIQEVTHSRACRVGKAVVLLSLIGLGSSALWAAGNDEQEEMSYTDMAASMAVMPWKLSGFGQSLRPALGLKPVQRQPVEVHEAARQDKLKRWKKRAEFRGTAERPRLIATKTNLNIYAQIIDDSASETGGHTLAFLSTRSKGWVGKKKNMETARELGREIAEMAYKKGISKVVFDRNGYKYHGIIKELAEGAREKGILDNDNPNRREIGEAA